MRNTDILIVDDEIGIREVLQETLEDEGYTVALAENAESARRLRNETRPAMVLLDIWMPDSDGITLLKEWADNGQLTMPVVMMSGHGSIDTAVEATKIGALDFLEKPISLQKLLATVERALKLSETQAPAPILEASGSGLVSESVREQVHQALMSDEPVILCGEKGAPFETLARLFHRADTAWVKTANAEHISEMPMDLLKQAQDGVLFINDVGQQGGQLRRAVEFLLLKAERGTARIVCVCHCSPQEWAGLLQEQGAAIQVINIPPLREQKNEIVPLIARMLADYGRNEVVFTAAALTQLSEYDWPGNQEQLQHIISSLLLGCAGAEISGDKVKQALGLMEMDTVSLPPLNFDLPLREFREELERCYFEYHIEQENRNMSRVAQKVGLERTHLYRKLKQLGIQAARPANEKE